MKIKLNRIRKNAIIPKHETIGSAGLDLVASKFLKHYSLTQEITDIEKWSEQPRSLAMLPGGRILIGCGFSIEIPKGYELQIRSRSGLALKQGLIVLNSPGTIDSDFRGEVGVILMNASNSIVDLKLGDKIAQAVLAKYETVEFEETTEELTKTDRGSGGFGHTSNRTGPRGEQGAVGFGINGIKKVEPNPYNAGPNKYNQMYDKFGDAGRIDENRESPEEWATRVLKEYPYLERDLNKSFIKDFIVGDPGDEQPEEIKYDPELPVTFGKGVTKNMLLIATPSSIKEKDFAAYNADMIKSIGVNISV